MKARAFSLFTVIAMLILIIAASTRWQPKVTASPSVQYRVIYVRGGGPDYEILLNNMAKNGWEYEDWLPSGHVILSKRQ